MDDNKNKNYLEGENKSTIETIDMENRNIDKNVDNNRVEKVKAVEEFLKKERKKSFNKGIILGGVVVTIAFVISIFAGIVPDFNADFKLKALEKLVDEHYLFQEHVDEDAAKEATYKGYINSLDDPYSEYMNKGEFKEFSKNLDGEFCGIGIVFAIDYTNEKETAKVIRVMKGYSADKAGVKPGDEIIGVDGKLLDSVPQSKIAQLITGKKGTTVEVTFFRESTGKEFTRKLERQDIKADTVYTKILDDGAGYIEVREFSRDTDKEFKKAIDEMLKAEVHGIIIDLRNNPGGLMDSCTEMLDYLLPKGTLVTTKYKDGSTDKVTSDEKHQVDIPMSIIINEMSASASEMFTGAMQDYGKATVVGTQSFGKGIVQNIYPLKDGSAVKITIAEYLTPKNRSIHKKGITPDVKVKDTRQSVLDQNDAQLRAAQESLKK